MTFVGFESLTIRPDNKAIFLQFDKFEVFKFHVTNFYYPEFKQKSSNNLILLLVNVE